MTHRGYTVTLWICALLAALALAGTVSAAALSWAAAVFAAGPAVLCAGAAAVAWTARRELRATHVADLAAAQAREDDIARH